MLGALIPLSDALCTTGGTDLIASALSYDAISSLPIGHQCNTLVMGPGGYRFGDYWRLGLPLSIIVLIVGVPLIAFFWSI